MSIKFGVIHILRTDLLLAALALGLISGQPTIAQTNDEVNAAIQFNFSSPGARSLALGGAFIGLADDATAAYANPAGLKILTKPEISIEGRGWSYTHVFADSGNVQTPDLEGLVSGTEENDVTGLSFISYVYPRKRWAIAVYRHELANFDASFNEAFGAELIVDDNPVAPVQTSLNLKIVNAGLSFSFKFSDAFSLGLGVSHLNFDINSLTERFPDRTGTSPPSSRQTQIGDDAKFTWNAGLLWSVSDRFSLGLVFRSGASFDLTATSNMDFEANFNLPDTYGTGLAWKPTDKVTLVFDYVRVEYSALVDDFTNIFNVPDTDRYKLDDGDEFHFGFEYTLLPGNKPLNLRLGAWYDPDHSIRYEGDNSIERALFRGGDDEIHYSFGLGRSFSERFQLDAAVDFSDRVDTTSLSAIFRF